MTESEERYRQLIDVSPVAMLVVNDIDGIVFANRAAAHLYGAETVDQLIGRHTEDLVHPDDRDAIIRRRRQVFEGTRPPISEYAELRFDGRRLRLDGSTFFSESRGIQIVWDETPSVLLIISDITERKQAEDALRKSEEKHRDLIEGSILATQIIGRDGKRLYVNQAFLELFGYDSKEEVYALQQTGAFTAPHERERIDRFRILRESQDSNIWTLDYDARRKDGSIFPAQIFIRPIDWEGDYAQQRTYIDLTARKEVERSLQESEKRYRDLIEGSELGVQIARRESGRIFANRACVKLFGYESIDELLAVPRRQLVAASDRDRAVGFTDTLYEGDTPVTIYEMDGLRKDGSIVPVQVFMRRILWEGADAIHRTFIDLTERKRAEEQLRQARKMEAVGQLTGGVAHDFNNLLTVVLGNLELLSERVPDDEIALDYLERALSGAQRGAELTHRLLAFSRKQALVPVIIDPRELVDGLLDLMRRTLGETIEIEVPGGDDLWRCTADSAQLESAVLNLAINARDAMPDGGTLTITTGNVLLDDDYSAAQAEVTPGEYVMVAVTDTGTGIPAEAIDHVFEPFFTTKAVGKGSGLGLSMVYGFVKQSGGHVTIDSEDGAGTTVKMYFPRSDAAAVEEALHEDHETEPRARGETIFVVEDDPEVRTLAVTLLSDLGYAVLEAGDGQSALAALDRTSRVNMLFTDIVLPGGISGPDLAEEVRSQFPEASVLFMSGYSDDAIIHHGLLSRGIEMLRKPFQKNDLARKVRSVLDKANA